MSKTIAPTVFCVGLCLSDVHAQRFTTVQLPTFQNFSMSTTIVVPDRGRVYLGGVNRSYRSSSRRGAPLFPGSSRAYGGGSSTSGVSVSAHIHDLRELDQARLAEWERIKASRQRRTNNAVTLSKPAAPLQTTKNHRLPRVSDVRRRVAAQQLQVR